MAKSFFSRLKFWKRDVDQGDPFTNSEFTPEYRLANRLKRYEKYVSQIHSIIIWDNPAVSLLCLLAVNILFWIFVSLEWRFYGIMSSALLAVSVHEAWTGHVWPEISVQASQPSADTPATHSVLAVSKVVTSGCASVRHCLAWMANLRTHQPGLFCCVGSLVCSSLLLLGRSVSGLLLVYALLMSALVGPGLYTKLLPPQLKTTITQYVTCVQQAFAKHSANDASDDEYIPVTTSEDIALLTRVSDLHHDTYDSLTNPGSSSDMVSGLGLMPSHEEDSLGTLSDMEPGVSQLPLDPGDDSDSNPGEHQIQAAVVVKPPGPLPSQAPERKSPIFSHLTQHTDTSSSANPRHRVSLKNKHKPRVLLQSACEALTMPQPAQLTEFSVFGSNVAFKLQAIDACSVEQRVIAEKLISDVIFNAQIGRLSMDSAVKL